MKTSRHSQFDRAAQAVNRLGWDWQATTDDLRGSIHPLRWSAMLKSVGRENFNPKQDIRALRSYDA